MLTRFCMTKRKHHFVPKLYLRAFQSDERRIHLYNIKRSLQVENASLRNQCYKHKLHGPDDEVEDSLAVLESLAAPVLQEVREKGVLPLPGSDQQITLYGFAAMQILRNPNYGRQMNRLLEKMVEQVHSRVDNPTGDDVETMKAGFIDPVLVMLENLPMMLNAILDLKAHLLVSSRASFITSDNPVVKYNQYCEEFQYAGITGATQKGLQIFVPLSPCCQLILYDGTTYRTVSGRFTRKSGAIQSDIDQLNLMQLISADEHIYFADWRQLQDVARLLATASCYRSADRTTVQEYGQDDDPNSSLLHAFERTENVSLRLSFLGLTREAHKVPRGDRPQQYRDQQPRKLLHNSGTNTVTFSRFLGRR